MALDYLNRLRLFRGEKKISNALVRDVENFWAPGMRGSRALTNTITKKSCTGQIFAHHLVDQFRVRVEVIQRSQSKPLLN